MSGVRVPPPASDSLDSGSLAAPAWEPGATAYGAFEIDEQGAGNVRAMARSIRWLAGAVFGLALATLIPFLAEKGAAPRGHAVLWIAYAALLVSGVLWIVITIATRRGASQRSEPLAITYSLFGSQDLRVLLRRGRPQIVLLEVGLKNPNHYNLEGIAINSLIPQGLCVGRCGMRGEPLEGGHWLDTLEQLPGEPEPPAAKDYWSGENITVAGNGSKLLFFKLRISSPGTYYLKTLLFGNVPEQEQIAAIEVLEILTDDMDMKVVVSEVIHDGERLIEGAPDNDKAWTGLSVQRFFEEGTVLRNFIPWEHVPWWNERTGDTALLTERSGIKQKRKALPACLPPLYELRRRLERSEEEVDFHIH